MKAVKTAGHHNPQKANHVGPCPRATLIMEMKGIRKCEYEDGEERRKKRLNANEW